MNAPANSFKGFRDLADMYREGLDYRVQVLPNPDSTFAVIAPHGGRIEPHTSEIASEIAGSDFNLYCFEGIRRQGNYAALHLTSHRFDEPRCLELIARCDYVIAIHGCQSVGQRVLLGGRDRRLKDIVARAIAECGIDVLPDGHAFPAMEPNNICNRGRRAMGVQIEITSSLRNQGPLGELCKAIRLALFSQAKAL